MKNLNFKNSKDSFRVKRILRPVSLTGVIVPWSKDLGDGRISEFKLACLSGIEYFIVADSQWREVFANLCWTEVKVIGLLNPSEKTLIPQKVIPKGPLDKDRNIVDLSEWKVRKLLKSIVDNVNELVFIPAAIVALMT
jgi:hypothetical protein